MELTPKTMEKVESACRKVVGDMRFDLSLVDMPHFHLPRFEGNATSDDCDNLNPWYYFKRGFLSEAELNHITTGGARVLSFSAGSCYTERVLSELGAPRANIHVTNYTPTKGLLMFAPNARLLDFTSYSFNTKPLSDLVGGKDFDYVFMLSSLPYITSEHPKYETNFALKVSQFIEKAKTVTRPGGKIKAYGTHLYPDDMTLLSGYISTDTVVASPPQSAGEFCNFDVTVKPQPVKGREPVLQPARIPSRRLASLIGR